MEREDIKRNVLCSDEMIFCRLQNQLVKKRLSERAKMGKTCEKKFFKKLRIGHQLVTKRSARFLLCMQVCVKS